MPQLPTFDTEGYVTIIAPLSGRASRRKRPSPRWKPLARIALETTRAGDLDVGFRLDRVPNLALISTKGKHQQILKVSPTSSLYSTDTHCQVWIISPRGFEPRSQAPEACALSAELWGRRKFMTALLQNLLLETPWFQFFRYRAVTLPRPPCPFASQKSWASQKSRLKGRLSKII